METEETPNTKTPEPLQQTITKTPPPRIKNPKRVAQGKKLAAISKAAKQRKKEKLEMERDQQEKEERCTTSLITFTGTILGTCCTLLLTYIAYSQWTKEKETTPKISKTIKKSPVVYKDLSQYDL